MLRLTSALKHEIKPDETSYIEFFFVVKANNIRWLDNATDHNDLID